MAELKINNKICPANIFANNRMLNDNGRMRKDMISIIINNGSNQRGTPFGRKIFRNFIRKLINPCMIHAIKKDKENNNVNAKCDVKVKAKGIKPTRLDIKMKKNKENNIGKYFDDFVPDCSINKLKIKEKKISRVALYLSGNKELLIDAKKNIINNETNIKNTENVVMKPNFVNGLISN